MLEAALRLVSITALILILAVFAVIFTRWTGSYQEYQEPPHVWFQVRHWRVLEPAPDQVCAHPLAPPNWVLQAPVRRSATGEWEIPCTKPLALAAILKSSAQPDWMLKLTSGDTAGLDDLVKTVNAFEGKKRFAINAGAQKVARYLRKKAPEWLFAADTASLVRLHLFESLWMEPAIDFWPDFVIASTHSEDGSRLSVREAKELHRRKKRILWNEVVSPDDKPLFPIDGVLTNRGPAEPER
jgi:hypothetical protein